jgi:hypothetical protein
MKRYKALFDENGKRVTTYVEGYNFKINEDGSTTPDLPDGVVDISEDEFKIYGTNKYIRGKDGLPKKIDLTPSEDDKKKFIKRQCKKILNDTLDIIQTYKEQSELNIKTSISYELYYEWLKYRQQIREFSDNCDLNDPIWPKQPEQ